MAETDEKPIQWLTTAPNPNARGYGADDGQRGWRQHAVRATAEETFKAVGQRPALCGLAPAHGWSIDMFASGMQKCIRCRRALGIACVGCRGKGVLRVSEKRYENCRVCAGSGDATPLLAR